MRARFLHSGLALLVAVLLLPLPAATGQPGLPSSVLVHLAAYDGRYDGAVRFEDTFRKLDVLVQQSFARACTGLGLDVAKARAALRARIHVHVRDADCRRFGADRARCRTVTRCGVEHQEIDLYAEYFLSGDSDLETVLDHEMVHAVMRARMGRARYEKLPVWIREGLAVHLAGEGAAHLRRTLLAEEDVEALMTGLMSRRRQLVMYPYAWLAIDALEQDAGPEGLQRFVRRLLQGGDHRRAVREVTGTTWTRFLQQVRHHARTRIQAEAAGIEAFQRARAEYDARRFEAARAAFTGFLETYPRSAFAPSARYYRARSWYREGHFAEAAAGFQHCIVRDLGRSGWIDECHLYLGIARHEVAQDKVAVAVLQDYLHLHPYADQHDLGYVALGRALERLGRAEEARAAFAQVSELREARAPQRRAAERELAALDERRAPAGR